MLKYENDFDERYMYMAEGQKTIHRFTMRQMNLYLTTLKVHFETVAMKKNKECSVLYNENKWCSTKTHGKKCHINELMNSVNDAKIRTA